MKLFDELALIKTKIIVLKDLHQTQQTINLLAKYEGIYACKLKLFEFCLFSGIEDHEFITSE